jgi:hypothetical protein
MSKTRASPYGRINFLPFADAMFSGVAIVIIILVSFNQSSSNAVSRPQADIVLRCKPGASIGSYSARFAQEAGSIYGFAAGRVIKPGASIGYSVLIVQEAGSIPGFAAGRVIEDVNAGPEIEKWLSLWPDLSARILLQEFPENRACAGLLKAEIEKLQKRIAADDRSGKAIPLISVSYTGKTPAPSGQEH